MEITCNISLLNSNIISIEYSFICFELKYFTFFYDMLKSAYLVGTRRGRPNRDVVGGVELLASLGFDNV